MTWHEWEEQYWNAMREAAAIAYADVDPPLAHARLSVPQDGYGWRGLHGSNISLTQPLSHARDKKTRP
jgi:hypothetical protein